MPAIPTSTDAPPVHHSHIDWPLPWVIIGVISILLFQVFLVIALIRRENLRSKARGRELRQRGVAILDGPSLIWTDAIPPAPTISTYNLRQTLQRSEERAVQ
jgi:hypothetical protein